MTVFESVLIEEYQRAGRIMEILQKELATLPPGSLRKKIINGKTYYYRQYRQGNKVISVYVKKNEVDKVKRLIKIRKDDEQGIRDMKKTRRQIEKALGKTFIDEQLSKGFE